MAKNVYRVHNACDDQIVMKQWKTLTSAKMDWQKRNAYDENVTYTKQSKRTFNDRGTHFTGHVTDKMSFKIHKYTRYDQKVLGLICFYDIHWIEIFVSWSLDLIEGVWKACGHAWLLM